MAHSASSSSMPGRWSSCSSRRPRSCAPSTACRRRGRGRLRAAREGQGAARDCLEAAIEYAQSRQVFDKPLAGYQITQTKIADMALEVGKGHLLAYHLGRLKDRGELTPEQVSTGKLNSTREAIAIARTIADRP